MKSIASKFNALAISLILPTTLATSGYMGWQHRSSAFNVFNKQAEHMAVMLKQNIEYGLYTQNRQAIEQALQGLAGNPDVAYVLVSNKDRQILAEKNYLHLSALPQLGHDRVYQHISADEFVDNQTGVKYLNIVMPVFMPARSAQADLVGDLSDATATDTRSELTGYVQLGVSQAQVDQDVLLFIRQALLVVPAIAVAGMFLTVWQTRRLTKPIAQLAHTAQSFLNTETGIEKSVNTKDEVATLTAIFARMSNDLIDYRQKSVKQRETLGDLVNQRTLELQQKTDEAQQLMEKAQAASKAKSEFLATMSHEIRTPMNGVLGMTELLINTELNSRQKRLAETAYRSAESLLGVINNILDFSKIEAGKFQLSHVDFDLRQLLEETVEMLANQAHRKHLELVLNLPVDLGGIVHSDGERLRQVLINLLGNAIKFTQAGEVQLKISRLPEEDHRYQHLLIEVSDTGPGIAADQQQVIFESFTQIDGSITRRFGGTGLGLTIAKQLVELMGGRLQMRSLQGQGSTFYFNLKLPRSAKQTLVKADISALKGMAILVVDDSPTNRDVLHGQLSYWGVDCDCVDSGIQALEYLHSAQQQNKHYQVLILDWHMPEMDGLTLAKTIKQDQRLRPVPMVMLSSDTVAIDADKQPDYGISYFLTKPVIQQKLLNCLLELIGQAKHQAPTKSTTGTNTAQGRGRILLAEDQPINQDVGLFMLRALGYQTEIANNGLEALKLCQEKNFDLILMDCHMPEMDGFDATKAIREHEKHSLGQKHTPIIALTADVQKGIVEQCLNAGMDAYLSKPFNKKQLQDMLSQWLPARPTDDILPAVTEPETPAAMPYIIERRSIVLNPEALENLRNITTATGETLLHNAIRLFLRSAPEALQNIKSAYERQDCEGLRKFSHGFKSVCANLGAQDLADCCADIEHIAKQCDLTDIAELLKTMDATLPKVIAALTRELDSTAQPKQENTYQQIQPELQGKRIMLIDDDSHFRSITASALVASGFIVDEAADGNEALAKVSGQIPDLIVLDAIMDGMDGFDVCKQMRTSPLLADVPIIMATGLGDIESINQAFEAGANDFIIKPINYPILVHRLWFILRASQNTAELRSSKFQLSAAQRIARLGYWTWDFKYNQFQISEHLANLCGIDVASFENTLDGFIALVHPDDQETVRATITAAKDSVPLHHTEYRLYTGQAGVVYVHQEIEAISENNHSIITGTVQDISLKKQTELQIHRLAYFDNLTGLASRAYYHERIEDFINNANRHNEKFAFLFLDLDGFKDINDSFGHDIGDHFLKAIAERLRFVVRDVDFAARLGGDEFCLILDNIASEDEVAEVADRCLQKVNQPLLLDQHQIRPRVSIGIALYPRDGANEIGLMKAADAAMYSAKQAGKQRYVFYSADMASQAITRLEREQMLRDAFDQDQFILYYQPQISMQTGRMISMEALIRWQHPEKGMIPPGEFIPLAEQLGLMVDLGNWVLRAACKQILQWHKEGLPYLPVAVNISPGHFQDPALFYTVKSLLHETGIPAHCLELEVTESAMQTEGYLNVFSQLRDLGIKIAIDDFGTGYSCLASLKQLPLDCLKVDKVFVDDVLTNPHTALLLGTIIGLANALDYTLVAEGVEKPEQALVMHGLGCHIIQGYLFSPPIPGHKIPELVYKDFALPEQANHVLKG